MAESSEEWADAYTRQAAATPALDADSEYRLGWLSHGGRLASELTRRGLPVQGADPERIAAAATRARDQLTAANRRLVVKIAWVFGAPAPHTDREVTIPELIARGEHGLVAAAERWDPRTGQRFSSYAGWWIHQAMGQPTS